VSNRIDGDFGQVSGPRATGYQVLDWREQVQRFSGPARQLLMHSIALEEYTGGHRTLRILVGPSVWQQLTEQLRFSIGLLVCMGAAGVHPYRRVTFEKTVADPLTAPIRRIGHRGRCAS
jgi:hypothetical protein